MSADTDGFNTLTPKKKTDTNYPRKDTIRISNRNKSRVLTINYYAYESLGRPTDVGVSINPAKDQIKLVSGGSYYINPKTRQLYSTDLKVMPLGEYRPIGNGVYQYIDPGKDL